MKNSWFWGFELKALWLVRLREAWLEMVVMAVVVVVVVCLMLHLEYCCHLIIILHHEELQRPFLLSTMTSFLFSSY